MPDENDLTALAVFIVWLVVFVAVVKLYKKKPAAPAIDPLATIAGFSPSIQFAGMLGERVAIDPASKQIGIISGYTGVKLLRFNQLVEVSVERNGSTITTTTGRTGLAGAAVGFALVGPLGLALGGGSRSTAITTSKITELSLKLYVNDLANPLYKITFFRNSAGVSENNRVLLQRVKAMEEWYGRFRAIMATIANPDLVETHSAPIAETGSVQPIDNRSFASRVFGD